ncbi:MAG: hypothetical protein WBD36_09455, partial [Bacteroidota bacterium]
MDVTFRYTPPTAQTNVWIAGEFNSWNNQATPLTSIGGNTFVVTLGLQVGGAGGLIPGAYQYKFYYNGVSDWPNDPLNHRFNAADHDNSILFVKNPTIYQFIPNQRTGLVKTSYPTFSAYLFPTTVSVIDTGSLALRVDSTLYTHVGTAYNPTSKLFSYKVPHPLDNGLHTVYLTAGGNSDSVT